MDNESALDRIADWIHRYGLIVVGLAAVAFVMWDNPRSARLFDSPQERTAFFRLVARPETRVLVLVTEWCPACKGLEAALASEQIPFTRITVEESEPGARLFTKAAQRTRSRGVPKVIVDDTLVSPSVSAIRSRLARRAE
jgi:glutaredoxin